jgi:hypothetical protein
MDPQSKPSTLYRSVSQAAVALALGGKFIRQAVDHNRVLLFEIIPPEGLDFDNPDLVVPVPALLAWTEALTARLRTFNRARVEGNR